MWWFTSGIETVRIIHQQIRQTAFVWISKFTLWGPHQAAMTNKFKPKTNNFKQCILNVNKWTDGLNTQLPCRWWSGKGFFGTTNRTRRFSLLIRSGIYYPACSLSRVKVILYHEWTGTGGGCVSFYQKPVITHNTWDSLCIVNLQATCSSFPKPKLDKQIDLSGVPKPVTMYRGFCFKSAAEQICLKSKHFIWENHYIFILNDL